MTERKNTASVILQVVVIKRRLQRKRTIRDKNDNDIN